MSFLNPVNEPVLRFSSTDADAPQINYAARTAGDVKAVLKACLDTGYGTKAGAGWTVINEVDHVAEFVSPSAAMSDFKLQIDDSTTTKTVFNYIKNTDAATLITNNEKTYPYIESGASDGWHLFVTDSGLMFIEVVHHKGLKKPIGRLTCFGQVKSALKASNGHSFLAFAAGWRSSNDKPSDLFFTNAYNRRHVVLPGVTRFDFMTANQSIIYNESSKTLGLSVIDMWSGVYLTDKKYVMAQAIGLLFGIVADDALRFDVADKTINNDSYFTFFLGHAESYGPRTEEYGFNCAIKTDTWEV